MSTPKLRYTFTERPNQAPEGWRVFNAPRPLYGTVVFENGQYQAKAWTGPFVSGIFYAAVGPDDPDALSWLEANRNLDASELVFITEQQAFDVCLRWYQASKYAAEVAELGLDDQDNRKWMVERGWDLLQSGQATL